MHSKHLVIATALVCATPAAASEMRMPYSFVMAEAMAACMNPVFGCDYTTKTCFRGGQLGDRVVVGVIVADADRRTVLRHIGCSAQGPCINFDTGKAALGRGMEVPAATGDDADLTQEAAKAYSLARLHCPDYDLDALGLPDYAVQAIKKAAGE